MLANVGDWIIKGVKGEFYPCKPDIFAQTYESVETLNVQPAAWTDERQTFCDHSMNPKWSGHHEGSCYTRPPSDTPITVADGSRGMQRGN